MTDLPVTTAVVTRARDIQLALPQQGHLLVDVPYPGGDVTFRLWKSSPAPPLQTMVVSPGAGNPTLAAPGYRTVSVEMRLAHQWQVLERMPTTYSHYNVCRDAGSTQPYPTGAWFLSNRVTDDLLYPPLYFTASQPGQQTVTSPLIRRDGPRFMPGNKVDSARRRPRIADVRRPVAHALPRRAVRAVEGLPCARVRGVAQQPQVLRADVAFQRGRTTPPASGRRTPRSSTTAPARCTSAKASPTTDPRARATA